MKENLLLKMERDLEMYQRKFSVIIHQQVGSSELLRFVFIICRHHIAFSCSCNNNDLSLLHSEVSTLKKQTVSQACAEAKIETFCRSTRQSNLEYKWLADTKASKVCFSYSHICTLAQWSGLPFCLPSLIVQWPARIFHF